MLLRLVLLCSVISLVVSAASVGRKIPIIKHAGRVKESSYIVKLKSEASKSTHLARLPSSGLTLAYTYDQAFRGYAARLDTNALEYIRQSNDVESIFEDGIIETEINSFGPENKGSLAPSSHNPENIRRAGGSGVNVYDIGTVRISNAKFGSNIADLLSWDHKGIYTAHTSFGGRAYWGATFGGYGNADGSGYDTCLAGIAVGTTYGVATEANIYAVKAMSDTGSGAISDSIAAINWVISAATASGRPSVTMLSAVTSANSALDAAVTSATSKGIHFIVPAPSSNVAGYSPARVASAVTVAIEGQTYTSGIDVCSKGTAVQCPSIQGPTASRTISGSSAAMARVAGIVAAALGNHGSATPASMEAALKAHASTTTNGCLVINEPW